MKWRSIVAGVDGTPEACRAAAMAWRIARAADVPCRLVYAVPEMWAPGGLAPLANSPEVVDTLVANVLGVLGKELGTEIPFAVRDALLVRRGRAGVALSEVARQHGASLIVVGRRHQGALERGRGGSTAHHLIRTGGAPVLVVEPSAPAARLMSDASLAAVPVVCTWCDPRSGRCS